MTRPRLIHDCPYCGRTKFADEEFECCFDDEPENENEPHIPMVKPQHRWTS